MIDEYFMEQALEQAEKALSVGEFPVGCVISDGENILAAGFRKGSSGQSPNEIDHAEMVTLRRFYTSGFQNEHKNLTIYCTMEPCLMCMGAIVLSGINKIVYADEDVMGGGTNCNLKELPNLYRRAEITIVPYILRDKSLNLFKAFFEKKENHYWKGSQLADYTLSQK